MSVVAISQPIVTFPDAPTDWQQWDEMDIHTSITPAITISEPKQEEIIFAFMDTEETTVIQKRPRRSFHREKTEKSPTRKRSKRVEIQVSGKTMTLAEYQAECARKFEQKKQEEETSRLYAEAQRVVAEKAAAVAALSPKSLRKHNKAEKKAEAKKNKTVKKSDWVVVEKVEKPISVIRGPDTTVPPNQIASKGTTLVLKNLPRNKVSVKELTRFFGKCGKIKFVNVLTTEDGNCKGMAFVRFENKAGSEQGLKMNEFWYENNKVYVEYARDKF